MGNIFENPFEDINANVLEPKKIVDYWCNPFSNGLITNFDENEFQTSKMPIILQGTRGSGKTTILKYYSYKAQLERANKREDHSYLKTIEEEKEIGFYFRCEDSFISIFESVFSVIDKKNWTHIFDHYLEMLFSKSILDVLLTIKERKEISLCQETEIVEEFLESKSLNEYDIGSSFNELYIFIKKQINYINNFKNQFIYTQEKFSPDIIVELFNFSEELISIVKKHINSFKDVIFILMFDEYENLTFELQRRFNKLIKFAGPNITFRIGRRSENVVTNETVNENEYLRESHDYFLVSLENELDMGKQVIKNYFKEVANKRLSVIASGQIDISNIIDMIGNKENYDEECRNICQGKKKHLESILEQNPQLAGNKDLENQIINIIKNDDNPIAETLNALWVIRSKTDFIDTATKTKNVMESFFKKDGKEDVKKYNNDYTNKYRYAITAYICSVYKKPKMYYGFNSLRYLSNGNTRTFLNLCRSIVNEALFSESKQFLKTGIILKETQSRAIHEFSVSEFNDICSIIKHGGKIRNLVLNIGNIFSLFHKDKKIRYPETNQFVFDEMDLYKEDKEVIDTAISWSIIVKKARPQRATASVNRKADIYYINRVFCPIFNISYRIRGGVNPSFTKDDIHSMLNYANYCPSEIEKRFSLDDNSNDNQLTLFDMEI